MENMLLDELKAILQDDSYSKYIYQTIPVLKECRTQAILEINRCEQIPEDQLTDPIKRGYPDCLFVYTSSLELLSLLCRTMAYKWKIKDILTDAIVVQQWDVQGDCEKVLQLIKKNPKASYWEIVSNDSTGGASLALEYLIETGAVVRTRAMNNPYLKDYSYWKLVR